MIKKIHFVLFVLLFLFAGFFDQSLGADKLLQSSDISYIGSFRVPNGTYGSDPNDTFAYGGEAMAFNPVNNSLFLTGHVYGHKVAEISIPTPKKDVLNNLNTAVILQSFKDITEGHMADLLSGGGTYNNEVRMGGLYVSGSTIYGSSYIYYDGAYAGVLSHFYSGTNLSTTGQFHGMYQVGDSSSRPQAGFIDGWITPIPTEYQSALGGTHITGNCCLAITGRTSQGPSAFAISPLSLGSQNPLRAIPLVYYTDPDHLTIGGWGDTYNGTTVLYNGTTGIRSSHFPTGGKTILYIGKQGTGTFCYGTGAQCNDPQNDAQGVHAYPYRYQIWAYNVDDLIAVKNGTKNWWNPMPYAVWPLPSFGGSSAAADTSEFGSAYDDKNKLLYVVQKGVDTGFPYSSGPFINVYSVNVTSAVDTTPPAAPTGLTIN